MPARNDPASGRDRRRRELLRALLEDGAEQGEPAGPLDAELLALLQELRGPRRGRMALRGLMSSEQLQGFMWGVGAAALFLMVLPTAKQTLRPFAASALKRGMDLFDELKTTFGEAGEGLQDLIAEVQFERMKEAVGPETDQKNK